MPNAAEQIRRAPAVTVIQVQRWYELRRSRAGHRAQSQELPPIQRCVQLLRDLGFQVLLGEHALKEDGFRAGTATERAEDINRMFGNPDVRAILSSHGGLVSNGILSHLDLPDFDDAILFLEIAGYSPALAYPRLHQLKHSGMFAQLRGIVLGNVLEAGDASVPAAEELLAQVNIAPAVTMSPVLKLQQQLKKLLLSMI